MEPITVNKQSSIRIEGSKVVYFDPLEVSPLHDADYIFITHPHFDHFSLLSILEIKKENTVIVTTKDIVEELLSVGVNEEYIVTRTVLAKAAEEILNTRGVNAAFVVGRTSEKQVSISARSTTSFNVQIIMEKMGGGGHLSNAATQIEDRDILDVRKQLLDLIAQTEENNTEETD